MSFVQTNVNKQSNLPQMCSKPCAHIVKMFKIIIINTNILDHEMTNTVMMKISDITAN